jgi:cell division protein FtsQ
VSICPTSVAILLEAKKVTRVDEQEPSYQPKRQRKSLGQVVDTTRVQPTRNRRSVKADQQMQPETPMPKPAPASTRTGRSRVVESTRPARPVAVIDLEATEKPKRPRRTNSSQVSPPSSTIRFASTSRSSARVMRGFGYNVRTNLNFGRMLSLLCLVGLVVLAYWLLNSSQFLVTQITVNGSRFLDVQGVIAQTDVDKINVFLLDEDAIATKLEQLPFVLEAHVEKALPNQLTVDIVERQEAVDWKIDGTNYLVDKDGVILQVLETLPANASSYPAINSLDKQDLKLGDKVDSVAVDGAQAIWPAMSQNGFQVASLDYEPTTGLTVVSKDGKWKALFGSSAELNKKISILKGLLADHSLKWSFADLRWTARPAIQ